MCHKQRTKRSAGSSKRIKKQQEVAQRTLVNGLIEFALPPGALFSKQEFHGNIKWEPEQLAAQALIWSWQDTKKVTDAFDRTQEICRGLGLKKTATNYTGFMNALASKREVIGSRLRTRLQILAEQAGERFFRTDGRVLMGFDGTRATAPRTKSNEKAFCAPTYGHGKKARYNKNKAKRKNRKRQRPEKAQPQEPQVWITMIWHMSLRLPWTWRLGPSNSSERNHVREILEQEEFPENTLFCGDAGFTGFPLWNSILEAGGNFLVRIGGNVNLLSEHADFRKLNDGRVLCWPKDRMHSGEPPLRLRLVRVEVGKTNMWMLTSVLKEQELTEKQIVNYYKQRWLIEVEFRGLKQTVDKHKLRCRNPERLLVELDWSLYAMAFAELLALRAQIPAAKKQKRTYTPNDRSLANTLKVLRRYMRNLDEITRPDAITQDLAGATVQRYNNTTDKRARYRPKNADKKPLGKPTIRKVTPHERRKLKSFDAEMAA